MVDYCRSLGLSLHNSPASQKPLVADCSKNSLQNSPASQKPFVAECSKKSNVGLNESTSNPSASFLRDPEDESEKTAAMESDDSLANLLVGNPEIGLWNLSRCAETPKSCKSISQKSCKSSSQKSCKNSSSQKSCNSSTRSLKKKKRTASISSIEEIPGNFGNFGGIPSDDEEISKILAEEKVKNLPAKLFSVRSGTPDLFDSDTEEFLSDRNEFLDRNESLEKKSLLNSSQVSANEANEDLL